MDKEGSREFDRQRDRFEVVVGIVGHPLVQRRVDDVAVDGDQDRVTVGSGLRGLTGADVAAGASDILDIELLTEMFLQFLRNETGADIGWPSWSIGYDQLHWPRWIGLRIGDARDGRQRDNACR